MGLEEYRKFMNDHKDLPMAERKKLWEKHKQERDKKKSTSKKQSSKKEQKVVQKTVQEKGSKLDKAKVGDVFTDNELLESGIPVGAVKTLQNINYNEMTFKKINLKYWKRVG
jgi:hypothetical protein